MEEEVKISFWKKLKISIFGLEDYQKLAVQKTKSTIFYIVIIMLIFTFFLTLTITYKFSNTVDIAKQYINNNIETLNFKDGKLTIIEKENQEMQINQLFDGQVIIDTSENISNEQISKYEENIKGYYNGIIILQDKVIIKTNMSAMLTTISLTDIANQLNLVKIDKQDIINILSGSNIYIIYTTFFCIMYIYLFIIYLSTVLLDAILYSMIGYITGIISNLRMRYRSIYNIAVYSLTLPIILNLIYIIINTLTGYTIKYFSIMYMAITCIYIITAILMIKSDLIKKQIELSKIIQEQEKVRQEMEEKERQKKEEEEKERVRKKDEKQRQEEKKKKSGEKKNSPKGEQNPEPQANIKPENS